MSSGARRAAASRSTRKTPATRAPMPRSQPEGGAGEIGTALARPRLLDLESFARAAGLHPDLVRRLVALGLLDAYPDAARELWFPPAQLAAAARIQRLRAGLSLNYAAIGVVLDLLDRIEVLETALRRQGRPVGGVDRRWT